jgi:transcriptional regulator with XRE-family HTH domain
MTVEQMRLFLRHLSKEFGSQQKLADELGVSKRYINDVINGREVPTPFIVEQIGYTRVTTVTYVRNVPKQKRK